MSTAPPDSPKSSAAAAPAMQQALLLVRGILGGAIGGALGYIAFRWLAGAGLYGIMVPGALLGLGAGLAARGQSQVLGVVCGLAAIALTIFAEWSVFPFVKDRSLGFFLAHVHELPAVKLLVMGLGALAAYWFGQGR